MKSHLKGYTLELTSGGALPSLHEPIRGNPNLRAENPNHYTLLNGQCNTTAKPPKPLHRVAPCCTQKFFNLRCNTSTLGLLRKLSRALRG